MTESQKEQWNLHKTQYETYEKQIDIGIPPQYHGAKLSDHPHGETIREWLNAEHAGIITLTGGVGLGKTRMLYAVKRAAALRNQECSLETVPDLCARLRDWDNSANVVRFLVMRPHNPLLLDDLGVEKPSEYITQEIGRLISKREEWSAPTLITTNLNMMQLSERYGDRTASRIATGKVLLFEGEDKRVRSE